MAYGRDTSALVDVRAHVTFIGQQWRASVEAHANTNRSVCEGVARLSRGRQGSGRRGKREEERVALGVDLDAVVARERIANDAAVRGEGIGVSIRSEGVEELRRAFDVRE